MLASSGGWLPRREILCNARLVLFARTRGAEGLSSIKQVLDLSPTILRQGFNPNLPKRPSQVFGCVFHNQGYLVGGWAATITVLISCRFSPKIASATCLVAFLFFQPVLKT